MLKKSKYYSLIPAYILVLSALLLSAVAGSRVVTTITENTPIQTRKIVIIDAGHGGVDGGATSCTGVLESEINLQIAQRLDDLMHLLGVETVMIRQADQSVHTEGNSIAAKKVSDLKQRVKIANNTDNAVLVSIHQNHFSDSRYSGAQVFYAPTHHSDQLAKTLQASILYALNPGSNRQAKRADGVYLMQNIEIPGILIECGFLSNHQEETKLRSEYYQKNLCVVISSVLSCYLAKNTLA